jgi:antitoxin (DNA-binding transcriptional repressor) of toxin-antitoxin stability system
MSGNEKSLPAWLWVKLLCLTVAIMHIYEVLYFVHIEMAMKQATFTEVCNHAKQYFDIVESGETVRVLRNGKPIADIVPVVPDLPSWKQRKAQPLVLDGISVSRMILEEREAGL